MTSVADFIKVPKKDFHNNLDLGMRYPSYVAWAGFYVPDFPEDGSIVKPEMRAQVQEYTQFRTGSSEDVQKLISLSLAEAQADNVTELWGTVNYSLSNAFETPENFVSAIRAAVEKYENKIKINPILAIDSSRMDNETIAITSSLLGSGLFCSVYLYGEAFCSMPQNFTAFLKNAKEHGLRIGINTSAVKSSDDFMKLLRSITPDVMVQGEFCSKDKEILNFMKKNGMGVIVTPNPDSAAASSAIEQKAQYLRNLTEAGVLTQLATESVLLFNKSITQFCAELCNTGLFSKDEIISLIQ